MAIVLNFEEEIDILNWRNHAQKLFLSIKNFGTWNKSSILELFLNILKLTLTFRNKLEFSAFFES